MTKILVAGSRQIDLSTPCCMGVLNVTPDSFSDGSTLGRESKVGSDHSSFEVDLDKVLKRAEKMAAEGALFLDIGGESTRPGASPVPVQEEIDRVVPVIAALRSRFDLCLSVDTSSSEVMTAAIGAGAELVNDVRALADEGALSAIVDKRVAVCLMHMRGQPRSMQVTFDSDSQLGEKSYDDVVEEVAEFLGERRDYCLAKGLSADSLLLDPGFGFGKSQGHNYELLRGLTRFSALGAPLLVGVSRKSMIGAATGRSVDQRLAGSVAAATLALQGGASIIRSHDVAATVDAIKVYSAFCGNLAFD
ncbi:MAG: dihydropteroate synthase [Gammaproteobacteria bacterium]|nr:dihydropteroate synthase [Gammaproteobacteria bacterium]